MKIILASRSPRRQDLLKSMGFSFEIVDADIDETTPPDMLPLDCVNMLARKKCVAVAKSQTKDTLVIGADTLVALEDLPLGKPEDEEEAIAILMSLSGKTHQVHTGVAVSYQGKILAESDTSSVLMRPFTLEEAKAYVATGEPLDKAGAYGIQGLGGALVEKYSGALDNIIGFPTKLVAQMLEKIQETHHDD